MCFKLTSPAITTPPSPVPLNMSLAAAHEYRIHTTLKNIHKSVDDEHLSITLDRTATTPFYSLKQLLTVLMGTVSNRR